MKAITLKAARIVGTMTLDITWANGKTDRVDLSALVADLAGLEPLDNTPTFAAVQVGEDGWSLIWPSGIEVGTDTLWRLAREQAGDATPVTEFTSWRERNGLSLTDAAAALGVTRRMVSYYEAGRYLIPRMVGLACKGWEADHRRHA